MKNCSIIPSYEQNLVSIITPSYNSARFISETIESVLAQTYQNWEMLITDDCSSDNSIELIGSFTERDSRIKLFRVEKNIGAAEARNVSLSHARGKYIAFLDSDDLWCPEKLKRQTTYMQENSFAFTMTAYETMSENGYLLNRKIDVPERLTYKQYLRNTVIGCLTVVIDRELTGDFRMTNIRSSHDMALWLEIMKRGFDVYGLKESLSVYRLVSTSNTAKKKEAAKDVWKVYRKIEKLSVFSASYNFLGYTINAILKRM
jgi:teichuronic acid biosynthesis glycosyltransferase TuaG